MGLNVETRRQTYCRTPAHRITDTASDLRRKHHSLVMSCNVTPEPQQKAFGGIGWKVPHLSWDPAPFADDCGKGFGQVIAEQDRDWPSPVIHMINQQPLLTSFKVHRHLVSTASSHTRGYSTPRDSSHSYILTPTPALQIPCMEAFPLVGLM